MAISNTDYDSYPLPVDWNNTWTTDTTIPNPNWYSEEYGGWIDVSPKRIELHCSKCGKLLAEYRGFPVTIENILCPFCAKLERLKE